MFFINFRLVIKVAFNFRAFLITNQKKDMKKYTIFVFFILFFASKLEAQNKIIPVELGFIDWHYYECPNCFVVVDTTTNTIVSEVYTPEINEKIATLDTSVYRLHIVTDPSNSIAVLRVLKKAIINFTYTDHDIGRLSRIYYKQE